MKFPYNAAFHGWEVLGSGKERIVLRDPAQTDRCLKLSPKTRSVQTVREAAYFRFLQKRGVNAFFVPRFYGTYEDDLTFGIWQEVLSADAGWMPVSRALALTERPEGLEAVLLRFRDGMVEENVIVSDLRTANMMVRVKEGRAVDFRAVDGFGSPEAFPVPKYLPFFGSLKVRRQWARFIERYPEVGELADGELRRLPRVRFF